MSLQLLIRKYIQVHQGKHFVLEMLLNDIMQEVSDKFDIDREDLLRTCNTCIQNKITPNRQCEGLIASKNNVRCTCPAIDNERYCKRHMTQRSTDIASGAPPEAPPRCVAINLNGTQCIRNAKGNNTMCGLHMKKQNNDEIRDSEKKYPCAYYDETENGFSFCTKHAKIDKWFCKKHLHLQSIYAPVYKSKSHRKYLDDTRVKGARIEVLEELLCDFT